jgi:hypothetical protein
MSDAVSFQRGFGALLFDPPAVIADPALARALAVHRNTSAKAAQDALADNFPIVRALVGAEAFAAAATRFVDLAPPTDPRLCFYGVGFASFLTGYQPFAEAPYLGDVATIEWLVVEALFAADAPALHGAAFSHGLDLDQPLTLHPALRHARLSSPAGSVWLAHAEEDAGAMLDALEWAEEVVLVTRPADAVIVTVVPSDAATFIEACASGLPLGDAAAGCGEHLPVIFAALISAGAFA